MKVRWLHSAWVDSLGILAPPFVAALLCLHPAVRALEMGPVQWLLIVVFIDVAHVYASLYRTYFDKVEFQKNSGLLTFVPLACWLVGVGLYSVKPMLFWTVIAYLAVFHFVRQQYGFLRLYSRNETRYRYLDAAAVYAATLYPLVYWHTHPPRAFAWFVEGDFLTLPLWMNWIALLVYLSIFVVYIAKEIGARTFNLPRNAVIFGTALSWYVGIVLYDSDAAFTITNVVSHGVPYFVLVWITCRKKSPENWFFRPSAIPLYLGLLLAFAYFEEFLWDGLVWGENASVYFGGAAFSPLTHPATLAWVIPLLALPQATHYVLDGFVWKLRPQPSGVGEIFTSRQSAFT